MIKTFPGGVQPACLKNETIDKLIKNAPVPREVIIPLLQHTGAPCEPMVSAGSRVRTGQVIARSDKFISSPIHASISGTVKKIDRYPHPVIGSFNAVFIEGDGADTKETSIKKTDNVNLLSEDEIRDIVRECGIVGLGGAAFPTHVKLALPEGKAIDSFILNGSECEPYLTCDHHLMLENPAGIIEGMAVMLRLTGASRAYIAIESNKIGAAFTLEKILRDKRYNTLNAKIVILKTKYPQGAEKSLIKSILNREVPPRGLPFDVGCLVSNVGTAFAVYEAVFNRKPLYERVVTVTGSCVAEPSNLRVRIGTPVKDLVDALGGLKKDVYKIIFGGPMMGLAQLSLDTPVIKGTSGILFLSKEDVAEYAETNCIRCGRCVDVCPLNMVPADIMRFVKKEQYERAIEYNVEDCIECGCCSYECPSKIPLFQWIKLGKTEVLNLRSAK